MDAVYQIDRVWLLDIQRRLYRWSRAEPADAYRDMWNWVTDPRNLRLAWRRVASNRGARSAGPDKRTARDIQRREGPQRFLDRLRRQLRNGSYRPTPVRRVMIPKRGKPGKLRPLGVPTVEDRVVQAALLQLLEPIFEADFLPVSYGFRPRKACRDALEHIRNAIRPIGEKTAIDWPRPPYQWVIEGDIQGCFDHIDHHHVMSRLRRRVHDLKVCRLVRAFLKAGVLADDALLRTRAGTPQGGVLSPLLANITLSAIEERYARFIGRRRTKDGRAYARPGDAIRKFRHYERKAGRAVFLPIRYADDFVVFVTGTEEQARDEKEALAAYLDRELKLVLSPEKTRITALSEGFLFLGHRVRLRWDDRWGYWPRIEIPKDRIKDLRYRIKQLTTLGRHRLSLQEVIDNLNPLLLGWGRFYQHCYGAKTVFSRIDHYVWDRIRRWLRKKFPKTPRLVVRRRYWRRLPGRNRYRWVDQRPVAIVADLKVGRHNLAGLRYPDYAQPALESPVHNERCTPGSGTGAGEPAGGNPGIGAPPPRSFEARRTRQVSPRPARKLRCAVYTRKSSEEGLELEFNSLHAQREAGLAYIASQRSEGWIALPDHYDDGGISGGTLERPALKRLLRDVEAGLIDVVVVYKIDRLSRSLTDFAKLVDVFERHNVTFVSVTQQFNTTTSMGRLTLNILLSFAQFEREVIGERIRDKFAASRRKGMWMGGWPPLGYEIENRRLVVVEREAALVRRIFDRFAKTGLALAVARELNTAGEVTKRRLCTSGPRGGKPWTKGAVYKVLANRVYLGEAVHKGVAYPGEHATIVDQRAWDKAHTVMAEPAHRRGAATRAQIPALLKGLIFGPNGRPMSPSHTRRRGWIYRYYVTREAIVDGYDSCPVTSVPAADVEGAVLDHLQKLLAAPELVARTWAIATKISRQQPNVGHVAWDDSNTLATG